MSAPYTGAVYAARNTVTGKLYIGKSIHGMEWRKRTHERYSRSGTVLFLHALKKYGPESFEWCELFCSDDDGSLLAGEAALIADYRAAGFTLYNMTEGGDGCAGRKVSPEQLAKMRVPRSEQAKANMRAGQTLAVREAKAVARRGKKLSTEARAKLAALNTGRKHTAEHRAKISAARAGTAMPPWSADRRAKMEAAWARRKALGINKMNEEARAKMSIAARNRCEQGLRNMSEAAKRRAATPEGIEHARRAGRLGAKARWKKAD